MKMIKKIVTPVLVACTLSACSTFMDTDNTPTPAPLVDFAAEINIHPLWYTNTGIGVGSDYLKLTPSISNNRIFTASKNGSVSANDKISGKSLWQMGTGKNLTGGVGAYDGLVYVGTREGELLALHQTDGTPAWKATSSSEILAPVSVSHDIVLAKTIDGRITAFSTATGNVLWHYQETEPSLILRGASAPQVSRDAVIVGFENGELAKLTLSKGRLQWQRSIAEPQGLFAIQRMIDITADPVILGNHVYAATYQGRIAALDFHSGEERWTEKLSAYAGIAADNTQVYASDTQSYVWAFNAQNGHMQWKQTHLHARTITGPAIFGNYLVVGDAEGYLHWLNKHDGHFAARTFVNSSGILATPIVENNTLYVYTKDGHLAAYTVVSR